MYDLISIPYTIIALLSYFNLLIRKDNRFIYSNNFLIAVTTLIILFSGSVNLLIAWHSGYLQELLTFQIRIYSKILYLRFGLIVFAAVLSLLNLRQFFRKNFKIQIVLLVLFIGITLINYSFNTLYIITPGWHTTIGDILYYFNFLSIFILGIVLNLIIVKFKLIPELRAE